MEMVRTLRLFSYVLTCVALGAGFSAMPAHAQDGASSQADGADEAADAVEGSIVRYDVLGMAQQLMSCGTFLALRADYFAKFPEQEYEEAEDVKDLGRESSGFIDETRTLFMINCHQTEEETAAWMAAAENAYRDYWQNVQDKAYPAQGGAIDGDADMQELIRKQHVECDNLDKVKSAYRQR